MRNDEILPVNPPCLIEKYDLREGIISKPLGKQACDKRPVMAQDRADIVRSQERDGLTGSTTPAVFTEEWNIAGRAPVEYGFQRRLIHLQSW